MRKEWMEPVIKVQEFVANEYVEPTMALEEQDFQVPITHAGLNTMPVQQVIFTMDLLIMMGMEYRILMKESLYGAVHGV